MKQSLKQSVADLVESRALDDAQLRRLDELQRADTRRTIGPLAVVASLMLGVAVALAVMLWPGQTSDRLRAIADEVAMNHLKQRPLEVAGESIASVRPYFNELDFQLIDKPAAQLAMGEMLGGRYCSIQGLPAAQLRLRGDGQKRQTLYQAPYDRALFGELPDVSRGDAPAVVDVRGLTVYVWVEKGLLFALATE